MDPLIVDLSALYGKTSFVYHISFLAPKDKPFLQMWARVWYARSDRLRIDPKLVTSFSPAELAGCSSRIATYRLLDESKIKGLVQKPRT